MLRTLEEVKKRIEDYGFGEDEGVVVFDNPDYATAFVGVTDEGQAVYDYDRMLEWLVDTKYCEDYEEAADFISWNQSFKQEGQPIILYNLE